LLFSRKQQDGFAPTFYQGFEENTFEENTLFMALQPALKNTSPDL